MELTCDFQRAKTAQLKGAFIVPRKRFIERAVKISTFARKTRAEAEVRIDPPGGTADILVKFEEGGRKRATDGFEELKAKGGR